MAEKKSEFVVTDRRRFGTEGEPRLDAPVAEEDKPTAPPPAAQATAPPAKTPAPPPADQRAQAPAGQATEAPHREARHQEEPRYDAAHEEARHQEEPQGEEMPPPPTAEEQHQQKEAYKASGKKIDELINASGKAAEGPPELTFERVIESFYMSALIQMGAFPQEGEPRRVDIIGARQTIDSMAILQEKTKGNLTEHEQTLLQNVLFQLRMEWIGLTNSIAQQAAAPPAGKPAPPQK